MTDQPFRRRIAHAIHRYDNHHALSGNDIPSKHHLGEADAVLAEMKPELDRLADYDARPAAVPVPPPADQTAEVPCVCGEPSASDTVHRTDGPCYVDNRMRMIATALARVDARTWATGERLEDQPLWQVYLRYARAVLAVLPEQTDRAAVLRWAADWFEREHYTALMFGHQAADALRRVAAEEQPAETWGTTTDKAAALGLTDTDYRARSHAAAVATIRAAIPGMYAHVGFRLEDVLNEADEVQPPETQAHEPTHTWTVESPRRDNWASWGTTYDDRDWALESYEHSTKNAPARPFRLVRATTTYTIEAEHTPPTARPAVGEQPETQETPVDPWSVDYHRFAPARLNPDVCTCGLGPDAVIHNEPPHECSSRLTAPHQIPVAGLCTLCHHHESAACHVAEPQP